MLLDLFQKQQHSTPNIFYEKNKFLESEVEVELQINF